MRVLVTGSSKGIGKEIVNKLLDKHIVYGISRTKSGIKDKNFVEILVDLNDTKILEEQLKQISNIDVIIHNAGVGYFGQFEDIKISQIEEMINVNFLAPMIITKYFLKDMKKTGGYIFNISSASSLHPARLGVVYSSLKAAIRQFGRSLFEEVRKNNIKVVNIIPDITNTNFYDDKFFYPDENEEYSYIKPEDIADVIEYVLNSPKNININEIKISPQIFRLAKRKNK